jgi:uncharacterized protein DUF6475
MNREDYQEFAGLLAAEVEIRNGKPLSEAAIGLWWDRMERFDLEQVTRAFRLYAEDDNGRFMPQPSDLIRHIQGTATDRAALAWGIVNKAMGDVGAYQDVDFQDPAAHAAIRDLGGWTKLCRTDLKELGYLQHRFGEAYRAYQSRGAPEDAPLALMGDRSPDVEYEKKGLPPPKPVLVAGMPGAKTAKHSAIAHQVQQALGSGT